MRDINNYYRSYEKTPEQLNAEFINFINNCVKDKNFQSILIWLNKNLDVPLEDLQHDCKNYLFINFNKTKSKFSNKFNIKFIFISMVKYLLFFIWIIIFRNSKKNKIIIKPEIIIDDIDTEEQATRFDGLRENFSEICYISAVNLSKKYNILKFSKYKSLNIDFLFSKIPNLSFFLTNHINPFQK